MSLCNLSNFIVEYKMTHYVPHCHRPQNMALIKKKRWGGQVDLLPDHVLSFTRHLHMQSCHRLCQVLVSQLCLTLCDPMEFSRLDYWSGQPFPSPGDLPNPGIESRSPALQTDSLPAEPQGNCWNLNSNLYDSIEEGIFVSYCCSNKLPQI